MILSYIRKKATVELCGFQKNLYNFQLNGFVFFLHFSSLVHFALP